MEINLKDIKKNIVEELNDAVKYMEHAVEFKGTDNGHFYCMMSKNETEHANILTKMFNKAKYSDAVTDSEYAEMNKDIMEAYIDTMGKIEGLKKLYYS